MPLEPFTRLEGNILPSERWKSMFAIEDIADVQVFGGLQRQVTAPGKSKRIKNHVLWTAG